MSRYPLHTVTLPILVEAESDNKIDGWVTRFPAPKRTSLTGLQIVTETDVWKVLEKWKRYKPELRRLCGGISLMRRAYEARDEIMFRRALESTWKWVPHFGNTTIKALKTEQDWTGTNWIYSSLMANLLQSSRFIFLFAEKDQGQPLIPGLYCPDWETAVLAFFGTDLVRECPNPKCGKLFIPKTSGQAYCVPAHGVAYRTARSRRNAKQRAKAKGPK